MANNRQGYHVQVTARSDRDLSPESLLQKVSDASGSKYSQGIAAPRIHDHSSAISSKPVLSPTPSSGGNTAFNAPAGARARSFVPKDTNVDEDGWGHDAPPVTRTQLENVQSAYQPTKVDMRDLSSQQPEPSPFNGTGNNDTSRNSNTVRGSYQPIGKVDIAALRRQAQEKGEVSDDRPTIVKGSYEPVGKVDIAAIKAGAQKPNDTSFSSSTINHPAMTGSTVLSHDQKEEQNPLADRSAPFSTAERLTSLPKPKAANRFGAGNASFTGTKAPAPGGFGLEPKPNSTVPTVGAGRTYADQGGKTPAQLWAEKKAREKGLSGASDNRPVVGGGASSISSQNSGEWKSGYGGKSWAPVQTVRTGHSPSSPRQQRLGSEDDREVDTPATSVGGLDAIRDRLAGAIPVGATNVDLLHSPPSPPPLDTSSKPNAGLGGIPLPNLPARPSQQQEEEVPKAPKMPTPPLQPPRSPTPSTPSAIRSNSPIRIAMPVGRGHNQQEVDDAGEEQYSSPPSLPISSIAQAIPHEEDLPEEVKGHDPARSAGEAAAAASFGEQSIEFAYPGEHQSGKRAIVQYDYEKAEDNELELKEGEYVANIEMVDDDWWMGQNSQGETGLFPSNYVELVESDDHASKQTAHQPESGPERNSYKFAASKTEHVASATALYDYEAAEGNELSFPENAKITGVVSQHVRNSTPSC